MSLLQVEAAEHAPTVANIMNLTYDCLKILQVVQS